MADRLQEQRAPVRLLMIDNYDSFTFNLVQYLGELGAQVEVVRNDVEKVDELLERDPAGVVISPGPGEPKAAGISVEMVSACAKRGIPLLGVCLGHQSIGVAFGGQIIRARSIMHGKSVLDRTRWERSASRDCITLRSNPLSFAGDRKRILSRGPRDHGPQRRWRDHGGSASGIPDRGCSVSPGVDPDAVGKTLLGSFLEGCSPGAVA